MATDLTASKLTPPLVDASATPPPALSEDDKAALERIKAHFSTEGFSLPVTEGSEEKKALTDREMMYLVSHSEPPAMDLMSQAMAEAISH